MFASRLVGGIRAGVKNGQCLFFARQARSLSSDSSSSGKGDPADEAVEESVEDAKDAMEETIELETVGFEPPPSQNKRIDSLFIDNRKLWKILNEDFTLDMPAKVAAAIGLNEFEMLKRLCIAATGKKNPTDEDVIRFKLGGFKEMYRYVYPKAISKQNIRNFRRFNTAMTDEGRPVSAAFFTGRAFYYDKLHQIECRLEDLDHLPRPSEMLRNARDELKMNDADFGQLMAFVSSRPAFNGLRLKLSEDDEERGAIAKRIVRALPMLESEPQVDVYGTNLIEIRFKWFHTITPKFLSRQALESYENALFTQGQHLTLTRFLKKLSEHPHSYRMADYLESHIEKDFRFVPKRKAQGRFIFQAVPEQFCTVIRKGEALPEAGLNFPVKEGYEEVAVIGVETIGRRKTATAHLRMVPGDGTATVNGRPLADYFVKPMDRKTVLEPLMVTSLLGKYDLDLNAHGGGPTGQSGAARLAVAKAIGELHPDVLPWLEKNGYLYRDPRSVERKKPGQRKARRKFQWVKR